jgi:DNA-binding CsgD family transcriptional regulator
MVTRTFVGADAMHASALVLRHLEDLFGVDAVPVTRVEAHILHEGWFGVLPRLDDLDDRGRRLAADFRTSTPELRGLVLALALQGAIGVSAADRAVAAEATFVDIGHRGRVRWVSRQHRTAVLAAATPGDHRLAARITLSDGSVPPGAAVHRIFAEEPLEVPALVAAADFYAQGDRPSWAVHCLVVAADLAAAPSERAALAAAAANTAALDGDLCVAERVLQRFAATDTRALVRESAPARALRQALAEGDPAVARATIRSRLQGEHLDADAASQALAVYALVNIMGGEPEWWEDFLKLCATAPVPLHAEIVAIAAAIGAHNVVTEPHLGIPAAVDGRGWVQLAACAATLLHGYRDMRLTTFAPTAGLLDRVSNRLVRVVEATYVSLMLAHHHHWTDLEELAAGALAAATDEVPVPLMRIGMEALLGLDEAFRGEREAAQARVDRLLTEPVVQRAHRLRAVLDSVLALIEGSRGNYERALALLSTRRSDAVSLTTGPLGPVELFDFVDYALMVGEVGQAVDRVEQFRDALREQRSERADLVLAACDALIAAPGTLEPVEEVLAGSEVLPFVYEVARLRMVYAERLRSAHRTTEARRQLLRAELDLRSVQAGAWTDRVQRALRACRREITVRLGDLTEQEARIAELAAGGLSNKEIGARLYLSPRTVGGHLYKIFPKLGITTRAQLRDALSAGSGTGGEPTLLDQS